MEDQEFWLAIRQALLALLDAVERRWNIKPRTSENRKWWRSQHPDELTQERLEQIIARS